MLVWLFFIFDGTVFIKDNECSNRNMVLAFGKILLAMVGLNAYRRK